MLRTKLNNQGVGKLLRSDGVRRDLTRRMQGALSAATSSAPVATGDYAASLHLEQVTTDRVAVRLVAGVPYAFAVEANTGNLSRALSQARR